MDTIIEKVLLLQNVEFFADFPSEQLSYLASIAEKRDLSEGSVLFRENAPSDALFIIGNGKVEMRKDDALVFELKNNEPVGTFGFFDQEPRIFTAVCVEPTTLLEIDSTAFFDLLEDKVNITPYLLRYFVKQLRPIYEGTKHSLH